MLAAPYRAHESRATLIYMAVACFACSCCCMLPHHTPPTLVGCTEPLRVASITPSVFLTGLWFACAGYDNGVVWPCCLISRRPAMSRACWDGPRWVFESCKFRLMNCKAACCVASQEHHGACKLSCCEYVPNALNVREIRSATLPIEAGRIIPLRELACRAGSVRYRVLSSCLHCLIVQEAYPLLDLDPYL